MAGLARICKIYGGMKINGKRWYWDYVADKAVPAEEMPLGSDRYLASERKKWEQLRTTVRETADE